MGLQHNLTLAWSDGGGDSLSQLVALAGGAEANGSETFGAGGNCTVNVGFRYASLQSLFLLSDVAGSVSFRKSGGGADTFALTAGDPLVYYAGCGQANPLTGDCTATVFASGGSSTGTFNQRVLTT